MIWRRTKGLANENVSPVHTLASRLGVERRYSPRAKFPDQAAFVTLPTILFSGQIIRMRDLSVGGCCLWDSKELLGPQIGQDVLLTMRWKDADEPVRARIVSRVDHRRHVQFLNLQSSRQDQIKSLIAPGIAGLDMRPSSLSVGSPGPILDAKEIWTSLKGDSLTIEEDVHRLAAAHINGLDLIILREAWPTTKEKSPASPREFEALLLFLANIPNPSQNVKALLEKLGRLSTVRDA